MRKPMLRKFSSEFVNPGAMKKLILIAGVLVAVIALFVTNSVHAQHKTQPMKAEIIYQVAYPVYLSKDIVASRNF